MQIIKKAKNYFDRTLLAGFTLAQVTTQDKIDLSPSGDFQTLDDITIADFVSAGIKIILIVAALVALFFLIIGGIKWITSGGDKGQVESARNTVTAALIGLLIVFAAWALIQLINFFFGIDVLSFEIPSFVN